MRSIRDLLPTAWPQRLPKLFGATMGLLTYGGGVLFFTGEAEEIWRSGPGPFFFEASLRLGGGILLALFVALPYYLAGLGARRTGFAPLYALVSGAEFVVHLLLTINVLFLGKGSTAAVVLILLPLYLCGPVALVWIITSVAKKPGDKRMVNQ